MNNMEETGRPRKIRIKSNMDLYQITFAEVYNDLMVPVIVAGKMTNDMIWYWKDTYEEVFEGKNKWKLRDIDNAQGIEQEKEELRLIKERGICGSNVGNPGDMFLDTDVYMRGSKVKQNIQNYGSNSSGPGEALSCALGSISTPLSIAPGLMEGTASRVRRLVKNMKVLSAGANGIVSLASFSNQEDEDLKGLFVIKAPIDSTNSTALDGTHEAFVGFFALNKLRNKCPNFMYTYAYFRCSPPIADKSGNKDVATWCTSNGKDDITYTVVENLAISGEVMSVRDAIEKEKYLREFTVFDFLSCLSQIVCALHLAWHSCEFTHYDLHEGNVLLRKTPVPQVMVPYKVDGKTVHIRSRYVATIIDFGMAHVNINGKRFGKPSELFPDDSVLRDRGNSFHDIFKFVGFSLETFKLNRKMKDGSFEALLELLDPFTGSRKESALIVKDQGNNRYCHPYCHGIEFDHLSYLNVISKVARKIGMSDPVVRNTSSLPSIPVWQNSEKFAEEDFQRTILDIKPVSPDALPIPTSFESFNDVVYGLSLRFGSRSSNVVRIMEGFDFAAVDASTANIIKELDTKTFNTSIAVIPYIPLTSITQFEIGPETYKAGVKVVKSAFAFAKFLDLIVQVKNISRQYVETCKILGRDIKNSKTFNAIVNYQNNYMSTARKVLKVVEEDHETFPLNKSRRIPEELFGSGDRNTNKWEWDEFRHKFPFAKGLYIGIIKLGKIIFGKSNLVDNSNRTLVGRLNENISKARQDGVYKRSPRSFKHSHTINQSK